MAIGFWKRFVIGLIDGALLCVSFCIYGIFLIIWFCQAKQSLGRKAFDVNFSSGEQLKLWAFRLVASILYCVTFSIFWWVELVFVCMKKGTFAEQWSGNYLQA